MISTFARVLTSAMSLVFLWFSINAQAAPLFDNHEALDVRISAPLGTLMRERSDVDYLDGTFSYTDEVGETRTFDLKLRARGRYRRQRSTCPFPPIRLNFRKGQVEDSLLDGQDKLKLIAHCHNRRAQNEQMVLREYLAYRILGALTEYNFRPRLLRVTYVDSDDNDKQMLKYGFVIEDEDGLGERIGMDPLKIDDLSYEDLDARQTNLINVFQYFIGNTDFSLIRGPDDNDCCHNSVPFSGNGSTVPIPYDFDFSGLVDAPYAEPNPRFKIRRVTTRHYRGRCSNNALLSDTFDFFRSKRADIMAIVHELTALDSKNRKKVVNYIDGFYEDIDDEKVVERRFIKGCS